MAIPNNYIDKITDNDTGESRLICPPAEHVRVENENFDSTNLDDVLTEMQRAIDEAASQGGIQQETDPTVPSWAKRPNPPTPQEIGAVPSQGYVPLSQDEKDKLDALPTSSELNTQLGGKADKSTTYTKTETDNAIANAVEGLGGGSVESVTINGTNHTPTNGVVDLGTIVGQQGPKGDTGNVQVDGDGNVLIVNNLTDGGTGAALSAEMGKRLALVSGTYEQAWQRSKVVTGLFCFLWDDTIDNVSFKKPIWHIGNSVFVDAAGSIVSAAQAANVPSSPTFTANGSSVSDNDTVAKNTQLAIAPASGSVLYYRLGSSGSYTASLSAVTLTLSTTGSNVISAYCLNSKGSSSTTTLNLTVAGVPTPTFEAKSGTTIDSNNVVSRGGTIIVKGTAGGTLHYKIGDAASYTNVASVGGDIPSVEITLSNSNIDSNRQIVIHAYNTEDGEGSTVLDWTFTMAELAAPTFSQADGYAFPTYAGGKVTINIPTGALHVYYTTNGDTPTSSSTEYTSGDEITISQSMTLKAIATDGLGESVVATASYTVPVDYKFQFKIALTGDNSTEYIPVEASCSPLYQMSIDWGDGTTQEVNTNIATRKSISHQYTGTTGDEFTVTLRGTAIPVLDFGSNNCCNKDALIEIIDNTLTCDTQINFAQCSNLSSVSANALQNNIKTLVAFNGTALTSLPDGLLSHLTKDGVHITSCKDMFNSMAISLSASQMNELKGAISHVTNFESMFYGMKASVTIPDDFFDDVQDNSVTRTWAMTNAGNNYVSGDAKKLFDVLSTKMVYDYQSNNVSYTFSATGLSNRDQVPTTWGGTMS